MQQNLAGIAEGQTVRIQAIHCTAALSSRLLDLGWIPGTAVTCVQQGAGIAAYRIRNAIIALRQCDAVNIIVQ
jgi:ferrous iron transport protein A